MACNGQSAADTTHVSSTKDSMSSSIINYYNKNKGNDLPSKSIGTTGNGSLVNGKLMPFEGANFQYFDQWSYLLGRGFVHHKVKQSVLDAYTLLDSLEPSRKFYIMECSHADGGDFFPHRTHQNGMSVDFMMPKLKRGNPYYGLDSLGTSHYFLNFNNEGQYTKDSSITIDFNTIAHHLLLLDKAARKQGLKIKKVIIKTELKDELFSTYYGKKLKTSGIYVVKSLTPFVNNSHDEHYHVDFEIMN